MSDSELRTPVITGEGFSAYLDRFDEEPVVHIDLGLDESGAPQKFSLPLEVWEVIRQRPIVSFELLDRTPIELEAQAREEVRLRRIKYEKALQAKDENARILACMAWNWEWDDPELSEEEWVFAAIKRLAVECQRLRVIRNKMTRYTIHGQPG